MVSPPATNWTSFHSSPASASASRAAFTPYSTKFRPHLPQGCMPTPRTATSPRDMQGPPLPHHELVVLVLVERAEDELHLLPDLERARVDAGHDLAEHHHLLPLELDRRDGVGLERVLRDEGRGRRVVVVGRRPEPAPAREAHLLELVARARGAPAECVLAREEHGPARGAARPDELGRRL